MAPLTHKVTRNVVSEQAAEMFAKTGGHPAFIVARRAMLWAIAEKNPDKAYKHARIAARHASAAMEHDRRAKSGWRRRW